MNDTVVIRSGALTAAIDPMGAELVSLKDSAGREYMTDADPRWWTGHAPILFPIVGALRDDRYRLDGRDYAMGKHGFARHNDFAVVERTESTVRLRLNENLDTLAQFPFRFALELDFSLSGWALCVTASVTNRDDRAMPFSFGFHPALAWPLPGGAAKDAHRVVFEKPEPAPIRRIDPATGLLLPEPQPSPVVDDTLCPTADLFEPDALIWDQVESRACTFGAEGGASIHVAFPDTQLLGIWQKPGAHYLCIEPWHGFADPQGFNGDLREKPEIMELSPGAAREFTMRLTITPPEDIRT